MVLNARVPPNAGHGGYESSAKVESEETSVAERQKDGGDGEIIREAVEEQVAEVFLGERRSEEGPAVISGGI